MNQRPEYQDLYDTKSPSSSLDFAKTDDPLLLLLILKNVTKVSTLVYSGEINKMLLDTLNIFGNRIGNFVALDMSMFYFDQIQE